MAKISFIIPSAPDRDPTEVTENLKKIHTGEHSFEIFVIKGTWPPAQRNEAIKKATGDIIILFDDDIIIPQGTIETAVKRLLNNPELAALGGPNLTPPQNTFLQKCFGYVLGSPFIAASTYIRYHKYPFAKLVDENHLITCNLAFKAEALKNQLFNEKIYHNEENELLGRIKRHEGNLLYDPQFWVYHHRRNSLKKFLKQIFTWGYGRGEHMVIEPKNFKISFLVPMGFTGYLATLPFIQHPAYFTPGALYLLLNGFFALKIAHAHKSPKSIIVTPWLMATCHILYGVGTVVGLIKRSLGKEKTPHYDISSFKLSCLNLEGGRKHQEIEHTSPIHSEVPQKVTTQ